MVGIRSVIIHRLGGGVGGGITWGGWDGVGGSPKNIIETYGGSGKFKRDTNKIFQRPNPPDDK